jgi:hypothetical protein
MSSRIGNMVSDTVMGVLAVIIFLLVGIALGPTVISSVTEVNATTLSGVPLATVIVLLATYIPSFYYLALVIGAMAGIWAVVKFRN